MATVKRYTRASGEVLWEVRYRNPVRGTTRKRGFRTRRDAEVFAHAVEVDKLTGNYVAPALGRVTVADLAPEWLRRKESATAPSHYRTLESAYRVHVEPVWGKVPVADIDVLSVENWITALSRKGSGATVVIRSVGVLSGILGDAVKGKRIVTNPAKGAENLPRKIARRHVYLTADDVMRLADASGAHRVLVLILAFCGLRWGEAIGLRVRDVEFLRRRLAVSENAVQIGARHVVGPTKGRKGRSVPVPEFVLTELSALCVGKAPGDLLFPARDGGYLKRPKSDTGWFQAAVKKAKVQAITPHGLRHTAASLAVSAGVNILALQRMLGHTSAKMTLDQYSDLFDDDLDAVAASLHAKYSPGSVSKACPAAGADTEQAPKIAHLPAQTGSDA